MKNELRQDPLTNRWVIIAKGRAHRPHEIVKRKEKSKIRKKFACPFCLGNEKRAGREVFRLAQNGKDWQVRSILNKSPYFNPPSEKESGLITRGTIFSYMAPIGIAEVFIETPDHYKDLVFMEQPGLEAVLEGYKNRYTELSPSYKEVIIFRNHGYLAGQTIVHPHSQITAMNKKSPETEEEERIIIEFHKKNKFCLLGHMEKIERIRKKRLIAQNELFVALCPWASLTPYEVLIIPKIHNPNISYLSAEEISNLALILQEVLRKLYLDLSDPNYNYFIRNYENKGLLKKAGHWYIKILPRLSMPGGYEASSGSFINIVPPEEAARQLEAINTKKSKWKKPKKK
jgi:UDPglucose--hexose-1-phosphate uridylyltransferase